MYRGFRSYGGYGGGFVGGYGGYGGPVFGDYGGGFRHYHRPMDFYGGWHGFHSHWAGHMVRYIPAVSECIRV
jgi:hypothetical protein